MSEEEKIEMADKEISEAGAVIADLLASTLMPQGGTWDGARQPYIWEHNALCWLRRNRSKIALMNMWTAHLLESGYPAKMFRNSRGEWSPAGAYWNYESQPRRESP